MSNSILQSVKDIKISQCIIYSISREPVNVLPVLVEFSFYEDIFSNCLTGNLVISDSIGLTTEYSWCGDEYLSLEFSKPYGNEIYNPISKVFRIYSIRGRGMPSDTNENYILHFCSEELLLSQKIRISRTYKAKRISDIVKSIVFEYLKVSPDQFPDEHIEPTLGEYNITIPNLKPLQAINWLCSLSISDFLHKSKESGATYLFWQTRNGYYFKSVLNILHDKNSIYSGWAHAGYYWYGEKNSDIFENVGFNIEFSKKTRIDESQNILSYKNLDSYDSLNKLQNGSYASKSLGIDYITRNTNEVVFDYKKYFGSDDTVDGYLKNNINLYKTDNKYSIMSGIQDRFGKTDNQYAETILKVCPTTTKQKDNVFVNENQSGIKDYNIEYSLAYRSSQFSLLSHNRFVIVIPGDHNISVGMVIRVYLPDVFVVQDKKVKITNKFLSGFYLITALRHLINSDGDYNTILEIRKDSYSTLPDLRVSSEGLPNITNKEALRKISGSNSL